MLRLFKRSPLVLRIAFNSCAIKLALAISTGTVFAQNERSSSIHSAIGITPRVSPVIVTVETPSGLGSGVIIDPGGIVVTNLHIIQGESSVKLTLHNGETYGDVTVVDLDEQRDLVVLKIKASNLKSAVFGNSDEVEIGEDVVLVGSPQGLDFAVSEGVINAIRDSDKGYRLIHTDAPAASSSCGGGMFNISGELVGIITSQSHQGQNLNFAVPINYIRSLISPDATMTLKDLTKLADIGKLIKIIEELKATESLNDVLDLVDAGDGQWIANIKKAENLDDVSVGIKLMTDEFDKSMVWIHDSISGQDKELSTFQQEEILKLNLNLNFAKVGIDDDGDILAMAEMELRTLDALGLFRSIFAVAKAANQLTGVLDISTESETAQGGDRQFRDSSVEFLDGKFVIRYNRSDWIERPEIADNNVDVDMVFQHSSSEVVIAISANRMQIMIENLPDLAIDDVRAVFPDAEITKRGFRTVNGLETVYWEHIATTSGVKFSYLTHAYSNSNGTIRIIGWTTPNLIEVHRSTIERFVAGLEINLP